MYRKYIVAAWRNLVSNRLYAAINIIGLGVGFTAALLIGLYVRNELTYDSWLPLHERTYLLGASIETTVRAPRYVDYTPSYIATPLKLDFPQIEAVARLSPGGFTVRRGNVEANEPAYWADPNIFDLLRLPVLAGDLANALTRPDGVVLTRKLARKYFGRDTPLGEKLEINRRHILTVTAVIEDLPSNSNLHGAFFASGLAAFSRLAEMDAQPANDFTISCFTYVRLRPGASPAALNTALPPFVGRHGWRLEQPGYHPRFLLVSLTSLHLGPGEQAIISPRGNLPMTLALGTAGLLIIVIAAFNFINLATARAARRILEIGIRKTMGASRLDIAVQFLCEALMCALLAGAIALALVEWLLPPLRAALNADLDFSYWSDPTLAAILFLFVVAVALAAASYPALLLSALRPAHAVKRPGALRLRQVLVVLQFAVLTALLTGVGVIYGQISFALDGAVRADQKQVHLIDTDCKGAFRDNVAKLAGVSGVTCSSSMALDFGRQSVGINMAGATPLPAVLRPVDLGYFEFYGLRPLAGHFFAAAVGNPAVMPVVVNETAVRKLNISAAQAVGRAITVTDSGKPTSATVIGVVADIALDTVHAEVPPAVYQLDPSRNAFLHVRLRDGDAAGTLAAMDRLWRDTGETAPINRIELQSYTRKFLYAGLIQQGALFAAFAGIAIFIAGLGLFGLAACTAERRIREVGVRKALGAANWNIVALFTWEFARPVLLANLIAWPLAFIALRQWLAGFAYHVPLSPWFFATASLLTLTIALATVAGHALLTARGKPGDVLRYQ